MGNLLVALVVLVVAALGLALGGALLGGLLIAQEMRLFLRAPRFYVQKLLAGPSASTRARRIASRIHGLIPPTTSVSLLPELLTRVERIPAAVRQMEAQREAITLYLEYDIYHDELGSSVREHDPAAVRTLEGRREQLERRIDESLTTLKRIESRVATVVLGAVDASEEGETRKELQETLEDLDNLLEASRPPELTGGG